ncbi:MULTISPECIES: 5-amino-6-(D-ribitylamino)uracil--L-tyrosine 4-hydroxyphenyl transferase CofH [Acidithrix]|uniref:FO synthase n=1 Tax=Acidithrix ferrooxidans TaxID=1280514 RepID=A0A0D8HKR9_9ACTN|nr:MULTISPECIES: 5-amino-6-(D-ribitylamino)uracil--L-tyrosine 4-hydroxyphenyl transferase CofH [Acidithrix]KJF17651.1 cyclic dehypoxanthine futalosine synthase [Acidithrix ferrooxidans]CAG4930725.1 unnamed protein product [Acidithrix sp. C25]
MGSQLSNLSTTQLLERAKKIRDETFGDCITFSPKVFIPLTQLCNDSCGYCTFVKRPSQLESPFLSPAQVEEIVRQGVQANCHEALFTLGERPEDRWIQARQWLNDNGYSSTVDYIRDISKKTMTTFGLLPHVNAGALSKKELEEVAPYSASVGMMLESIRGDLDCHKGAPDKTPQRRLETIKSAGELAIPFTTGLLVGIGDDESDRIEALEAIAKLNDEYGHIQEVIIQNFLPKDQTRLFAMEKCDDETFLRSIALARIILPTSIHLQAPPNLSDNIRALIGAGIDDFGGISPVTIDHVNPERPWPHLEVLAKEVRNEGYDLIPRLPIYPEFARDEEKWLRPESRFYVMDHSDSLGYGREDDWVSGGDTPPPEILEPILKKSGLALFSPDPHNSNRNEIDEIIDGILIGHEINEHEIEVLFGARGSKVRKIAAVADELRAKSVGDTVTFVRNRNINYTNICTFKCRFCAFSKGPLSLNLRGTPYLLDMDQLAQRVVEASELGATEVCLQGGIHPSFDGNYYIEVAKTVRSAVPEMHIHGFSALEVHEGARRLGIELSEYLQMLKDAGLKTLPGTAAEILDDDIRARLCPDKINTRQWLDVHRAAHGVGLRSNITIMFGTFERPKSWAKHFVLTRDLQKETGGFTEFVPLPFVHMASPIYLQQKARRGPTFRESLLMHSVARLAYHGWIDNIQASWVKMGIEGARTLLRSGANDLGGTLMEENISRAAGASHGQLLDLEGFKEIVNPLGRRLAQRSTLYKEIAQFS